MKNIRAYISFALLFVVATILTQQESEVRRQESEAGIRAARVSERKSQAGGQQQLVQTYGRLPLAFEANHGQTDGSVKFLSRGNGYTLFLTANEAVLALRKPQKSEARSQESGVRRKADPSLRSG